MKYLNSAIGMLLVGLLALPACAQDLPSTITGIGVGSATNDPGAPKKPNGIPRSREIDDSAFPFQDARGGPNDKSKSDQQNPQKPNQSRPRESDKKPTPAKPPVKPVPVKKTGKSPLPDAASQEKATKTVRSLYARQYADTTAPAKRRLAQALLAQERNAPDTATESERFVLLREARDLATASGDITSAFGAIARLDSMFVIDPAAMKLSTVLSLGTPQTPQDHLAVAGDGLDLAQQLIRSDDFDSAGRVMSVVRPSLEKSGGGETISRLKSRADQFQKLLAAYDKAKTAIAKLKTAPSDPESNRVAGIFYCLEKEDWTRGLPLLALGLDADLKIAALKDLSAPRTPETQEEAGSTWWDLSDQKDFPYPAAVRARACFWYERAIGGLTGPAKTRAERRIADYRKPQTPPVPSAAAGSTPNPSYKDGLTPLHLAVMQGNRSTVQRLIDEGAGLNLRDHWGRTPLKIARQQGFHDLAELLSSHGAVE